MNKDSLKLYAVTDRSWLKGDTLSHQVELAIAGGVTMVQLREKDLSYDEFLKEAYVIKDICKKNNVIFIINDNVELAREVDADGVHVGQSDLEAGNVRAILGKDKIVGVTAKTVQQAKAAEAAGADYLGSGAVFGTTTKKDAKPMDMQLLKEIVDSVNIPVVAIGGIDSSNAKKLAGTGIAGMAVVSGIFAKDDITKAAKELLTISDSITRGQKLPTALSIAGSDSSGGAGVQADIKTMMANGVYAMSAVTALTAQNTTGVTGIMEVTPEFLEKELDSIFTDIYPDAVKTGMVASSELIRVIAKKLKEYKARNIVIDPVMVSTSGASLISEDAKETLKKELFPLATLITPNIPEAEELSGMTIENEVEMIEAARFINEKYGCAVLLKGGHSINDANDLLCTDSEYKWFKGKRIDNPNTHGTGCTLSSAIASNLAKGETLEDAVQYAKNYISGALAAMLDLGKGSGPMNHGFAIEGNYKNIENN